MKIKIAIILLISICLLPSLAWCQEDECGECKTMVNGDCTLCAKLQPQRECIAGLCVPPDMSDEDIEKLEKAEKGDHQSLCWLAKEHIKQRQFKKALLRFRDAASKDKTHYSCLGHFLAGAVSAEGSFTQYHALDKGIIPLKYVDYQQAENWLLESAKRGDNCSMGLLCRMYTKLGRHPDSYEWCNKCITEKHHEDVAAFQIGRLVENGWGYVKNKDLAINYYRKAAEKESEEAKEALRRLEYNPNIGTSKGRQMMEEGKPCVDGWCCHDEVTYERCERAGGDVGACLKRAGCEVYGE